MSVKRGLAPLVVAALVALAYWPGLYGFWTRDDFMQLAFARLVGSPWPPFVHDHYFPVPGSVFRPLGFASFWLWQALFGTNYFAHAFGDMLLHIAVCLALYRVIRAGLVDRVPAVLCALAFALHPAVLGTALWWSARFDLLAALLGLVAVRAAFDYVDKPRVVALLAVLAATLAALLSKETALAGAGAVGLLWSHIAWIDRARRSRMLRATAALAALVASFFFCRAGVLGTMGSGLAGDTPLVEAFARGLVGWFVHLPGYVSYSYRGGGVMVFAMVAFVVAIIVALAYAFRSDEPKRVRVIELLVCGACLFALPALLQAPVVGLNAAPLTADASAVEAAMQSRLYYFSMCGLAIALAAGLGRVGDGSILRASLVAVLAVGVGALGWTSHRMAAEFATLTAAPRAMAEAVAAAVDRVATTRDRCHVVLLGTERPPEWDIYVSMDSVAKALSANLDRTGRCFVHADYPTYFNLMLGRAMPDDALPYTPHANDGRPVPWLHVGDLLAAYLDPPANADAAAAAGIVFLRYENGTFVEAPADAAALR